MKAHRPGYLGLATSGRLRERVVELERMLEECSLCPRKCGANRNEDELGTCATGSSPVVASWTRHFGEEPVISGRRGSGTVFLANCNLRCVFCQNHEISQRPKTFMGRCTSAEELARVFLELQNQGCHNINWVSPTHQVPQLVRSLAYAADQGLALPVVYNSNGYDSVEALQLLDGVVDIYMPDLKYADRQAGLECSRVPDYPERARASLTEMFRQLGDEWLLSSEGVLLRGLLVRILVLPNGLASVEESLRWIATQLSPRVAVSLMAQYYPSHLVPRTGRYPLLERTISAGEWERALAALERWMERDHHYIQDFRAAPAYYRPDFSNPEVPFADVRDFVEDRQDHD